MYFIFGFLILILCILCIIMAYKRRKIICKVCCMCVAEKCRLLNELAEPFGYSYNSCWDVFSSTLNAWQKDFGYTELYDRGACAFSMVFDAEPIYFDYDDKTWLLEFWKGQYGINTGGEIGIYYADGIIPVKDLSKTIFYGANPNEMLDFSFHLYGHNEQLTFVHDYHWWLTGFCVGLFSKPKDLIMDISISFPNDEMMNAFTQALIDKGYKKCAISICGLRVSFKFVTSHNPNTNWLRYILSCYSQFKNRIFCKLFLKITNPFNTSLDRLLYLYYFLPFAFRNSLRMHRYKKRRKYQRTCSK